MLRGGKDINKIMQVGFEVLTAVSTKMAVFWVVVPRFSLMMEAARTSKILVNFYQTTRRYNPEGSQDHVSHDTFYFRRRRARNKV
jgi:hypothetical protein